MADVLRSKQNPTWLHFASGRAGDQPHQRFGFNWFSDMHLKTGGKRALAIIVSGICIVMIIAARRLGHVGEQFEAH